jgi:phosphoglycolate phosphatase-like HAD superfamily hydrolase
MVGDTPWDVHAARAAGVATFAVLTGGFAIDELRESGAAAVFESLADLRAALDRTQLA